MPRLGLGLGLSRFKPSGGTVAPAVITIESTGPQSGGDVPISYTISRDDAGVKCVIFDAAQPNPTAADFVGGATYVSQGTVALTTTGSPINLTIVGAWNGSVKLALLPTGGGNADVAVSSAFTLVTISPVATATFDSADWVNLTSSIPTLPAEVVYAFRVTNKFTEGGAGDTTIMISPSGTADSFVRINDANNDSLEVKLENNAGGPIINSVYSADWAIDATRSIFIRCKTGSVSVWVDGVERLTSASAYTTVKALQYINTTSSAGAGQRAMQITGFAAFSATGSADVSTGLAYSDFFDGSNLPINAAFSGAAVKGFTPDKAFATVADWNGYVGMNGAVT